MMTGAMDKGDGLEGSAMHEQHKQLYGPSEFGYSYVPSSDHHLDNNCSSPTVGVQEGDAVAIPVVETPGQVQIEPFKDVKFSSECGGGEEDKVDKEAAAVAGLYAFCCCLSVVVLIVGAFLYSYDSIKGKNGVEIAGAVVLAVGVILFCFGFFLCWAACCVGCAKKMEPGSKKWKLKRLNDKYEDELEDFKGLRFKVGRGIKAFSSKKDKEKEEKQKLKKDKKKASETAIKEDLAKGLSTKEIQNKRRPVVFKVDFDGDIYVSTIDILREQISMCIAAGSKNDTVCVLITSGGGSVTMYGLAAAQLARVRKAGMQLVVCVDSIAASGGYMMATMANKIIASPFAMVGSIGVISIVPNVQKLLEKHNINTYVFTAGKYKRTVDVVGEVTDDGKAKMIEELESIHQIFKDHIVVNRPALRETIDDVATGEAWLSVEAKPKGLVDEIMTSDEYLADMSSTHDIIAIEQRKKKFPWDEGCEAAMTMVKQFKHSANPGQNHHNLIV